MPEQNAFPAPVKMRTRAGEFSRLRREHGADLRYQFVTDGVSLIGTIEGERGDAGVEGELESLVGHSQEFIRTR